MASFKGKIGPCEYYEYKGHTYIRFTELGREIFYLVEQLVMQGKYQNICKATLKDETRPIAKVKLGKTRLFAVVSWFFNLIIKKWLGAWLAAVHAYHHAQSAKVGVSQMDHSTASIALMFLGLKTALFDTENFDFSHQQTIDMAHFKCIAREFYRYSSNSLGMRMIKNICYSLLNSYYIVGGILIQVLSAFPSGCLVTAEGNSPHQAKVYDISAYRAHLRLGGQPMACLEFARMFPNATYGDDCILGKADPSSPVTAYDIVLEQAKMGYTLTNSDKTPITDDLDFVEQPINFLKRTFILRDGWWFAALDKDVICEIPQWIEGDPSDLELLRSAIKSSQIEMSLHGRAAFDEWRSRLASALESVQYSSAFLLSYDTAISSHATRSSVLRPWYTALASSAVTRMG